MLSRREFFSLTASAFTLLPSLDFSVRKQPLAVKADDKVSNVGNAFKKCEEVLMMNQLYGAVFPLATDTVDIQKNQ